jgi:hypothetical protein
VPELETSGDRNGMRNTHEAAKPPRKRTTLNGAGFPNEIEFVILYFQSTNDMYLTIQIQHEKYLKRKKKKRQRVKIRELRERWD